MLVLTLPFLGFCAALVPMLFTRLSIPPWPPSPKPREPRGMTPWTMMKEALAMTLLYAAIYGLALVGTAALEPEALGYESVDLVLVERK